MESLNIWDWKEEPISPSSTLFGDVDDECFSFDNNSESLINDINDAALYQENDPLTRAQVATKFLEELELDNGFIKEEPFADWLEEKVEFLFEDIPSPECGQNKPIVYPTIEKEQEQSSTTTQSLLQEFETVLGDVEACHQIYPGGHLTLTPPQSPPATDASTAIIKKIPFQQSTDTEQLLLSLESSDQQYPQDIPTETTQDDDISMTKSYYSQISSGWNAENVSLAPLVGDVDFELAAVDEYVRSCAEDMSPSSPSTSSNSSYISDDSNDDPEWSISTSTSSSSNSDKHNNKQLNQRITKNRSKPYSRPAPVDKKIRKKEQNKNAATRYRQKKKAEIKEIVGEEQELIDHNEQLNDQVKDLQREIGYLKGLMRDLFKAKGLIK